MLKKIEIYNTVPINEFIFIKIHKDFTNCLLKTQK